MAGRAAERMLLDDEPAPPADDLRQARELAMLIFSSEEAIETFIAHCDVAARDLLLPYRDVVMALSIFLRIKRTLDGAEIDNLISDVQARKAQAIEHARRKQWQRTVENAAKFTASLGTEQMNPSGIGASLVGQECRCLTLAVWKLHTPTNEENDLSLNEQLAIRRAIAAGLKWAWREVHSIAVTPR